MCGPASERAPVRKTVGEGFRAGIVEPHAIDERLIGHGAEHARHGIARLRVPCDAAKFAEAKAERRPHGCGGGLLVHAGSEADWIGELQPERVNRQRGRAVERIKRITQSWVTTGLAERGKGAVVNLFGLVRKERRTDERAVEPRHAPRIAAAVSLVNRESVSGKTLDLLSRLSFNFSHDS